MHAPTSCMGLSADHDQYLGDTAPFGEITQLSHRGLSTPHEMGFRHFFGMMELTIPFSVGVLLHVLIGFCFC